jgi:hypothetical protein
MLVMISDVVGLAVFVATAINYRQRGETHKRLRLLGATSMLPPAILAGRSSPDTRQRLA